MMSNLQIICSKEVSDLYDELNKQYRYMINMKDEYIDNLRYIALREVEACTKEVKEEIPKFSLKDYYYKYGKINFLSDYYQKLASKTFTVKERCEELEASLPVTENNEE